MTLTAYGSTAFAQTARPNQRELIFHGDTVRLAAQIDYPTSPPPKVGFPLIFVLPHAGAHTRRDYDHYTALALECGYAVFRWDKRGSGSSGSSGRGSPLQDAITAYQTALAQPGINRQHVVILGQNEGTLMLSDIFADLERTQPPRAAVLIGNLLDRHDILKVRTEVRILIGEDDWISSTVYGHEPCEAHQVAYGFRSQFSDAHNADRLLRDTRYSDSRMHTGARQLLKDWLTTLLGTQ